MLDKILAIFALACLVLFLGVLVYFVPLPDLTIIIGIVAAMAAYDFYRQLRRRP